MEKKKVLGISFGRKMMNTDVMIKAALMECEKAGCDVQFIRADDLDIKPCTGCISCVVGMTTGRGKGGCPIKDDFHIIDEALMECDAVIVGSPTYEMSPTGRFKTVCDRIGPSHDITFRKATYEEGLAAGKDPADLPDVRSFKKRVGALISVGGAMTKNWLAFMLPTMYEFTMSMGIDVIDMHEYYGAMAHEHVLGNEAEMERMRQVGQNIAVALQADSEEERTKWRGEEEGRLPGLPLQYADGIPGPEIGRVSGLRYQRRVPGHRREVGGYLQRSPAETFQASLGREVGALYGN